MIPTRTAFIVTLRFLFYSIFNNDAVVQTYTLSLFHILSPWCFVVVVAVVVVVVVVVVSNILPCTQLPFEYRKK